MMIKFISSKIFMFILSTIFLFSVAEGKGKGLVGSSKVGASIVKISKNPQLVKKSIAKGNAQTISKPISNGHAFKKHVREFKEIKKNLTNNQKRKKLNELITATILRGKQKPLLKNRIGWKKGQQVVIYNPKARDKGTTFKPKLLNYFENKLR